MMKRTFLGGVSSRRFCGSSVNHSTSFSSVLLVEAQTWITVVLSSAGAMAAWCWSVIVATVRRYPISKGKEDSVNR